MIFFRCDTISIYFIPLCIVLIVNDVYCLRTACDGVSDVKNSEYEKLCSNSGLSVYVVNGTFENPTCRREACIRKCCPIDSEVVNKTCVPSDKNFTDDLTFLTSATTFYVVYGFLQCTGRTILDPSYDTESEFSILENGRLKFSHVDLPITNYCVDYIEGTSLSSLVCFQDEDVTYYTGRNYKLV
ncbi:hypothetical protein Trydic_g8849 [Trypoxylus dichotomus]